MSKKVEKELSVEELKEEVARLEKLLHERNAEYESLMNNAKELLKQKDKRIMELVSVNEIYIKMVQGK